MKDFFNSHKPYFIIEEGQFNLGSFDKAKMMIELAAQTYGSAIEFQLAYAKDFYINTDAGYNIYAKREFSDQQLQELVDCAKTNDLHFIATCLSHKLVQKMADYGCTAFNINASDINNPAIVDSVIETELPFFVSLPLATEDEIEWVVSRILNKNPNANFALLHGQHSMASGKEWVEQEDTSLGYIETLKQKYKCHVGFIDHTANLWMPAVAVAAGATIISKHLTPSHVYKGPDHAICLDPEEMKTAVELAQKTFSSMQTKDKYLAKGEDIDRSLMRRSIVAARDISNGQVINEADIAFKRPGTGIAPQDYINVIGKTALTDIKADTIFNYLDIK